jgi:hypothetical protein
LGQKSAYVFFSGERHPTLHSPDGRQLRCLRPADQLPVWTLPPKSGHEAAIDLRAVPGVGAEIVMTVDGELRRSRLFRSHEQAELSGAIADTRATFLW